MKTNHSSNVGFTEHIEFVDLDVRMLTVLHQAEDQRRLLVICPSLGAEQVANYRREVCLARRLAARGTSALRYHPRGHGDSRGTPDQLSIEQLATDAIALARRVGGVDHSPVSVLGTRVSARVATIVAAELEADSLALWCPVAPKRYLREALRARAVGGLKQGRTPAEPEDALDAEGHLDVVGFEFSKHLCDEFAADDDIVVDGLAVERALVVDVGRRGGHGTAYAEALGRTGCDVAHRTIDGSIGWWLATGRLEDSELSPESKGLIHLTSTWIEEG